jgi:hypothetical protein
LKRGISTDSSVSSDEVLTSPPKQNLTLEESRVTTDAIHPRFQDRSHLLFTCRSCNITKAKERKMQKHFLKNCPPSFKNPRYSCPLPECGGPSFVYQFQSELRIYHSCKEWAKFCKSRESSSYLSSLSNSSISFASTNLNGSTTESSLNTGTSKISYDISESIDESCENSDINIPLDDVPSSENGVNGVLKEKTDINSGFDVQ